MRRNYIKVNYINLGSGECTPFVLRCFFVAPVSAEAGYVATPIAMVQAAITILNEPGSLPKK